MMRYFKTYRCVVDGQQEKMYLKHLGKMLSDFPQIQISFNISIGNPKILEKSYEEYNSAFLFDFDNDRRKFEENLDMCITLNNKQKDKTVYSAYSNICFDLWLVLHKEDYFKHVTNNNDYVDLVRELYGLEKTANIKSERVIRKILDQITLNDVNDAIYRAKKIRKEKQETDIIMTQSSKGKYYDNPDIELYRFIEDVITGIH